MKKFFTIACVSLIGLTSLPLYAGNIPQYKLKHQIVAQEEQGDAFKYLENAIEVKSAWDGDNMLFANGAEAHSKTKAPGFEIGFPFRYGGQVFTHFAISNCGVIYLGDETGVNYNGMPRNIFTDYYIAGFDDNFYFGMHYPAVERDMPAVYNGGEIHYKTEGEEGNRKTTVEYKNIRINGQSGKYIGLFDLQLVMHENGEIDMVINELQSPSVNLMIETGLRGWDPEDSLLVGSYSLGSAPAIYNGKIIPTNTRTPENCVRWYGEEDYDHRYMTTYTFTPSESANAPESVVENLAFIQEGNTITVTGKKGSDAAATLVVMSEKPIDETCFPEDGVTYGVKNTMGEWIGSIGDARVIYYGDDESFSTKIEEVSSGKRYYVAAFSANGYPNYNTAQYSTIVAATTQAAPSLLSSVAKNANSMTINCEAEDPVIIAYTLSPIRTKSEVYIGLFGEPSTDAKVGDEIAGGGKVIYVGDASEFEFETEHPNRIHYFQAWTVKDGILSATSTSSHGTTVPSLPYQPELQEYPQYVVPDGLVTGVTDPHYLSVISYGEPGNRVPTLRFYSDGTAATSFQLPEIETTEGPLTMVFEYAMETFRGYENQGGGDMQIQVPLGYMAGKFGSGSLDILCNNTTLKRITEYHGEMQSNGDGGFISGTATWERVEVAIPAENGNKYNIGFRLKPDTESEVLLRNIKVVSGTDKVSEITAVDNGVLAVGLDGRIVFTATTEVELNVYSINGVLAGTIKLAAGQQGELIVAPGVYVVNGIKVMVR